MGREHHHDGVWATLPQLPEQREAVSVRQLIVQERKVQVVSKKGASICRRLGVDEVVPGLGEVFPQRSRPAQVLVRRPSRRRSPTADHGAEDDLERTQQVGIFLELGELPAPASNALDIQPGALPAHDALHIA